MDKLTINNNNTGVMDAFIKLFLAVILAGMPFFLERQLSLVLLSVYLLAVTLVSGIKLKTILLSTASYGVIVLFPYLFGILMNGLLFNLTNNGIFVSSQTTPEILLRLFRLFVIWYVSILYFHSTPIRTVVGLMDKILAPLKLVGIPVKDYLKVVMCVVLELKEKGTEMKERFLHNSRQTLAKSKTKTRINFKGISQVIVSQLVKSLEKIDEIQKMVESVNPDDLYSYKFCFSRKDGLAVLSIIVLFSILLLAEKGYWL